MSLLKPIEFPIPFFATADLHLSHPSPQELQQIVEILVNEGLDVRRLKSTKNEAFESRGKAWLEEEWARSFDSFKLQHPQLAREQREIELQMTSCLSYLEIPSQGSLIQDPFNMKIVEESKNISTLMEEQMLNSIVVKREGEIIAFGRLLEVEGSVELVSLWTKNEWRRKGIASKVINELLLRTNTLPIFSFQTLPLVPYYLREYNKLYSSFVCPFQELPAALQRDLFRMNIFWGQNLIIKIGSSILHP